MYLNYHILVTNYKRENVSQITTYPKQGLGKFQLENTKTEKLLKIKHKLVDCTSLYCYTTLTWLQMCFDLPADRGAQLSLPCHT